MYHIRTTKTASKATAVQVVRYENRKRIVVAHLGSAHNEEELTLLKHQASDWIEKNSKQLTVFKYFKFSESQTGYGRQFLSLDKCRYLGVSYTFIYEVLSKIFYRFQLHTLSNNLLTDLVLMRIIEPVSKVESLKLLKEYFGIEHSRRDLYRILPSLHSYKDRVESYIITLAKKEFKFDFSIIFYDVTTLYFETFHSDDLRKIGFSKDNKLGQPQILIGLVVNIQGFPIAYEIFEGNKFEGHTLIPVISTFKRKYKIKNLTVVADAAMISMENIEALKAENLSYIVGARIGNLAQSLIQIISNPLNKQDGTSIRVETNHGSLICDFSIKRYKKDKHEMEKQLKKTENYLKCPAMMKKTKFLKTTKDAHYELNSSLIGKTSSLLGIKGYYTNLGPDIDNAVIINQYHKLWHIEQAFRISKTDLRIRPIYHFKQHSIKAHVLICFMALAICKYMELKSGKATRAIVKALKSITDAKILNTLTNNEIILRSEINNEVRKLLHDLNLSH